MHQVKDTELHLRGNFLALSDTFFRWLFIASILGTCLYQQRTLAAQCSMAKIRAANKPLTSETSASDRPTPGSTFKSLKTCNSSSERFCHERHSARVKYRPVRDDHLRSVSCKCVFHACEALCAVKLACKPA